MSIPTGAKVKDAVEQLGGRLRGVASVLYDLDQSASLTVLDGLDDYTGRTQEVLGDVAKDREWLWPVYTAVRERVEEAAELVGAKAWDEARARIATPLDLPEAPAHDDLVELVEKIAETATAVVDVVTLVAPQVGEHVGLLGQARSDLGRLDEQAARLGLSTHPTLTAARGMLDDALSQVASDPLGTDPRVAQDAVERARLLVTDYQNRLDALPKELDDADRTVLEIEVLIARGREALERTREKIARPSRVLKPMDIAVIAQAPRGLAPWLDRLVQAHGEGDVRAALIGMESWSNLADELRGEAEKIVAANEAPLKRRDELRGLLTALKAKAAASGLAEDSKAQALHDLANDELWVAPCDLARAEAAVDAYRRYLARR